MNFKYKDKVIVIGGFFTGQKGVVLNFTDKYIHKFYGFMGCKTKKTKVGTDYMVELQDRALVFVDGSCLRKI